MKKNTKQQPAIFYDGNGQNGSILQNTTSTVLQNSSRTTNRRGVSTTKRIPPQNKITKKQLEYLAERVKKLHRLTNKICVAKMKSFI